MADSPKPAEPIAPPPVQFTMDEAVATGVYVNFANIIHNPAEFVIDFGRIVPGRNDVKILSRILTSPVHAKQLLGALSQNLAIYEKTYGPIRTDFDRRAPATPTEPGRPN